VVEGCRWLVGNGKLLPPIVDERYSRVPVQVSSAGPCCRGLLGGDGREVDEGEGQRMVLRVGDAAGSSRGARR
jgi:hypothetical protein